MSLENDTRLELNDSQDSSDGEEQYVEFDLGANKSGIVSNKIKNNSTLELIKYGKGNKKSASNLDVSSTRKALDSVHISNENSVRNSGLNPVTNSTNLDTESIILSEEEEDSDLDLDWKPMNTELDIDMYDEKGNLIANSDEIFLQNNKELLEDGSKLGYTRIAAEEQVSKFNLINKEFDYLFNKEHEKDPNKLHSEHNLGSDNKIYFNINDKMNHNSKESLLDVEEMTTVSQLNSTKEMLKDSQKIAYVGLVKLIIVDLAIDLSRISLNNNSIKANKRISTSHLSLQQWSIKMMDRLFEHMELSSEERVMIQQLSSHGIEPKDLIPSLVTIESLDNPLLKSHDETQFIKQGDNDDLDKETLQVDIKWTLVCDLFLNLIFDAVYDARSRMLLLKFGEYLGISNIEIFQFERRITDLLEIEESSEQIWNEREILEFRKNSNKKKKMMYIGLATLGGGLVIGLSVGLLAPVIGAGMAAGLTTLGVTGSSSFLAGVGGTSIVTTVGVLSGAHVGSKGMLKRVGSVKTFEFRPIHDNKRVSLIITVSGWMNGNEDDVRLPFSTVDPVMGDIYSLLWEPEMLKSTGQTINILATEVLTQSIQQILGSTILVAFMASIQWPMMLSKLGYLLDNPWNVSLDRAWAAGVILADTLIQRNLGVRPVTLVGFSLGARLIYSCLLELQKRGAYGLVQDVILFGSPVVFRHDEVAFCRTVISGRFINGYSKKDWILGYLFRATSGGLGTVAGLAAIEDVPGVENFDCTEFVNGHMEYRKQIPKLLKELNWEVLNEEFVEIDEPQDLERQRELIHEFENVKDDMDNKKTKKRFFSKWFKPQKKEWWEVYDEGRKEVEERQKNKEQNETDELFDIDEIAREAAKIEVAAEVKTPKLSNDAFQPRSFKTKSAESTPVQNKEVELETPVDVDDFKPREFKSPKFVNKHDEMSRSSLLLQHVTIDSKADVIEKPEGISKEVTEKPEGTLKEITEKPREEEEEHKIETKAEDTKPNYFYDDDEFLNTGDDIKMSFA